MPTDPVPSSSETPVVSVVVPSRGGRDRLPGLLDSLAAQDLDQPWELIVVLDGVVDGSADLLEDWRDRLPLQVLRRPESGGVAVALNEGYAAARGEVVVRCDDDLTLPTDFLSRHLAWHRENSDVGVVSPTRDVFPDSAYARGYGQPANERLLTEALARPEDLAWMHWAACNSVRRVWFERVGGFDPDFGYREDSELGYRLARAGVRIVIDPELVVDHRGPATTAAERVRRAWTSGHSQARFWQKHPETRPEPRPDRSLWDRATTAAARRLADPADATRWGRRIDRLIGTGSPAPYDPHRSREGESAHPVDRNWRRSTVATPYRRQFHRTSGETAARRLVAFGVESAAKAGLARPDPAGQVGWQRGVGRTVSVVVPHFGDPAPTLALLDQLARQASVPQVIVVDDCSPDPFPETPLAEVVRRPRNGGFGSAVNSGAAIADGELLLVLNSDLSLPEGFVHDLLDAAAPFQPVVAAPRVVDPAGHEAWNGRRFPRMRHQVVEWLTPLARFRDRPTWHRWVGHDVRVRGRAGYVDWVSGAAMLIPATPFREVGGFDERFFMNSEEVDLQRRLRRLGIASLALQQPTVVHTGGGSTPSVARRRWLVDSRLAYADKWGRPGSRRRLQAALAGATAVNLVGNAIRQAAGRDIDAVATVREEWRLLRGTRR